MYSKMEKGTNYKQGRIRAMSDFKRRTEYQEEALEQLRTIKSKTDDLRKNMIFIPSTDSIIGYYGGMRALEVGCTKIKKGSYEWQNVDDEVIVTNLEKVWNGMPYDSERHTQQIIALNNSSLEESELSVCGFETSIPEAYFEDNESIHKPEIDLVLFDANPTRPRMILVEYKCTTKALTGNQDVEAHAKDYAAIYKLAKSGELPFVREMLNAYNVRRKIEQKEEVNFEPSEITLDIAFLFTGNFVERNNRAEKITEERALAEIEKLKEKCQTNTEEISKEAAKHMYWRWESDYKDVKFDKYYFEKLL